MKVKGIGTCMLDIHGGRTLYLYNVFYVPVIRQNLISVITLIKLGFNVIFHYNGVDLFLE